MASGGGSRRNNSSVAWLLVWVYLSASIAVALGVETGILLSPSTRVIDASATQQKREASNHWREPSQKEDKVRPKRKDAGGLIEHDDASTMKEQIKSLYKNNPTPKGEVDALRSIFNTTGGQTWVNRSGWEVPGWDPCTPHRPWFGLTCSNTSEVISIALPHNNLTGALPSVSNLNPCNEITSTSERKIEKKF